MLAWSSFGLRLRKTHSSRWPRLLSVNIRSIDRIFGFALLFWIASLMCWARLALPVGR